MSVEVRVLSSAPTHGLRTRASGVAAFAVIVLALATGANHRDEPGFDPLAPNTHSRYATVELDSDQPGATGRCLLALVYDQDCGVDRVRLALAAWVNDHGNTGATTGTAYRQRDPCGRLALRSTQRSAYGVCGLDFQRSGRAAARSGAVRVRPRRPWARCCHVARFSRRLGDVVSQGRPCEPRTRARIAASRSPHQISSIVS